MKSSTMKNISYAILIIGIIGSIFSGELFKAFDFDNQKFVYNTQLAIISVITILILFFIMIALSTLMEEVEVLRENQKVLLDRVTKTSKHQGIASNKAKPTQAVRNKNANNIMSNSKSQINKDNQTDDSWGKPSEISKTIYDIVLSVLDDMDECIDGYMRTKDFLKKVQDAHNNVKKYCDSVNMQISTDEHIIKIALGDMATMQDITMDEIEEYKDKFLQLLNFEE